MSFCTRCVTLFFLLFSLFTISNAQNQKAYMNVISLIQRGETDDAIVALQKEIKKEKKESEWYKLLDDTYKYTDDVEARISLLEKAVSVKNVKEPELLKFRLAVAYFDAGRYDESITILNSLPQKKQVKRVKENCLSAKELRSHPVDVEITDMGDSINTPYDNIWPFIDNDKAHFYTTVVVGKSTVKEKSPDIQEDICVSESKDGAWMPVYILQGELRSRENEGACTITADGRYLFFAACNRRDGGGGCEIYYSVKSGDCWSKPVRATAPLNTFSWQSTPSISSDGKNLYFSAVNQNEQKSANQRPSEPQKDIYVCTVSYTNDGNPTFSDVRKLGPEINSDYDEISPFISPYNDKLYFASDGRGGIGGLDIYYSKRQPDGSWGEAVNIGYPINTHRDEFGFVVDVDGRNGYLSCNGIEGGEFRQNKRIVKIALSDDHRSVAPFEDKGTEFVLENIYFDTDKSELKPQSFEYLDRFAEYLDVHPLYNITITGHTDNTGSEEHNLALSKARATSVADYLIDKGIDGLRITTEGLGSSMPVMSNDTEEGRGANRRIEVKLKIFF